MPQLTAEERKRISETRARDLIAQGRGSELSLFQQEKYGVIPHDVRMEQTKLRNIGAIPESKRSPQQALGFATADVGQYSRPTSFGQHLRNALSQAMGAAGGEQLKKQRAELRAQLFAAPQTIGAELTPFQLEYFSPAEQRRLEALRMGGLSGQLENIDTALQERGATLEQLLGTGLGLYGEQQQAAERRLQALLGAQEKKAQAEQDLQSQYRQFLGTQGLAFNPLTGEVVPVKGRGAGGGGGQVPSTENLSAILQAITDDQGNIDQDLLNALPAKDRQAVLTFYGQQLLGQLSQIGTQPEQPSRTINPQVIQSLQTGLGAFPGGQALTQLPGKVKGLFDYLFPIK